MQYVPYMQVAPMFLPPLSPSVIQPKAKPTAQGSINQVSGYCITPYNYQYKLDTPIGFQNGQNVLLQPNS
jgi:hypothetical protein